MPNPLLLLGGVSAVTGLLGANAQAHAAKDASNAQSKAADAGIQEQQRQFDLIRQTLSPYIDAGTGALSGQQDLLGLNGDKAQSGAINDISSSPQFIALRNQGFNAINQNAAATGGLRGGNNQAALGQFAPNMLQQLIQQQYANLGGMASAGQNAAAQQGAFGQSSANNISSLYGQQGAAQAGNALAQGQATSNAFGSIGGAFGGVLSQALQPARIVNPAGGTMANPSALPGGLFQGWGF